MIKILSGEICKLSNRSEAELRIRENESIASNSSRPVIEQFQGALNLKPYFHTLSSDETYVLKVSAPNEAPLFVRKNPLETVEMETLLKTIKSCMVRLAEGILFTLN